MSYGGQSDEIAESFADALKDLGINSRYEISNLTVIAKENTDHSLTISEALKTHIKQVAPPKKLPAFYVLDSIVKNVGTPYTLFFGRQLYQTFMEAYALVDNNTRAKMVEMLKTWKEPVPGSMDTRPVFPPEVTRPIENALIKARTSFLQAHQERTQSSMSRGRPGPSPAPYRETPTPPNAYRQTPPQQAPGYQPPAYQGPGYQAPGYQNPGYPPQGQQISVQQSGYPSGYPQQQYGQPTNGSQYNQSSGQQYGQINVQPYSQPNGQQQYSLPQRPPSQQYTQPPPAQTGYWQQQQQPVTQNYGASGNGIEDLNNDIEKLISSARAEWPQNPNDTSVQTKLKALLDLQTILQSQKLPPDQILLIKDQVAQLSRPSQPAPQIQSPIPPPPPVVAVQPPAQQPTLSSILGPGALAALLARQAATSQAPTQAAPLQSPSQAQVQPAYQPPPSAGPTPTPLDSNSLLEKLRAAGMLSGPAQTPPSAFVPSGFPSAFVNTPPNQARTPLAAIPNDVVLKAASLKIPRPHLIVSLYAGLGAPCTQCGRRFQSDVEGKKKKAAHMDWHFHVRQRLEEAESRGQHRSWYVDELDWIKSREVEGETGIISSEPSLGVNAAAAAATKLSHIPVPDDPVLAASRCPICQEKFEMKWLDELQEFVWMDAKWVGARIFHASCDEEAAKDVTTQNKRGITPEPVLGKRKADDDQMSFRTKIKTET
ncbi:uncharacterized protein L3040_006548 [Drepanopeziza brunnea f. sp. 'multigermtubi']|uniref:uncharacterized protein n=1 Tax=Drepanopeziza brunnea f. sp. 'multigermtubi' TaxID=698441 RepID=UPI0023A6CBFF|nr:hypothetical protein L3040_006548 [Drepanopeziza brunnea f. sp. 'multigermtubi']